MIFTVSLLNSQDMFWPTGQMRYELHRPETTLLCLGSDRTPGITVNRVRDADSTFSADEIVSLQVVTSGEYWSSGP